MCAHCLLSVVSMYDGDHNSFKLFCSCHQLIQTIPKDQVISEGLHLLEAHCTLTMECG